VQGTKWNGIAHSSDWYVTIYEGIVGTGSGALLTNPDGSANTTLTGPRPPDGHNLWPALMGSNATSPRTEVIHAVQNKYFNNSGGNCSTCKRNTGVSAARFGDYKIILGSSCSGNVVPWPELAPSPVAFGKTTGWVRNGTNWAYAGLLKTIDSGTGLALNAGAEEAGEGFEGHSGSDWTSSFDLDTGVDTGPDPTCATGIPTQHSGGAYCCLKSCAKCGCPGGNPYGPGGQDGCCANEIFKKGKLCSQNPPPCVLTPEGPTPAPTPKGKKGCLFNVVKDLSESVNLRNDPAHADLWNKLVQMLADRAATGPPLASAYPLGEINHTASAQICDIANRTGVLLPQDY
jgi:hypothetical protein